MSNRERRSLPANRLLALRATDREVLSYLNKLRGDKEDDTCTASLPAIADACNISERQAQISTGRLIEAGLLERIGYDFGNAVRSRRGTKYRLLCDRDDPHQGTDAEDIEQAIHTLIRRQQTVESRLTQLTLMLDKLYSQITRVAAQPVSIQEIKRLAEMLSPEEQRELIGWLQQRLRRKRNLERHPAAAPLHLKM